MGGRLPAPPSPDHLEGVWAQPLGEVAGVWWSWGSGGLHPAQMAPSGLWGLRASPISCFALGMWEGGTVSALG